MAPPQIPLELVTDIVEVAVELLIEEERHLEAHEPLSNRFLLSAALVDRTWHSIAVKVLLKRGIVTSGSVLGFLAQVKAHGMEATLESLRFGEASGGVTEQDAAWEDTAFDFLVGSLPGLRAIELLESGSRFRTALPPGRIIHELQLVNYTFYKTGIVSKFKNTSPAHLLITETREAPAHDTQDNDGVDLGTSLLQHGDIFEDIQSMEIFVGSVSAQLPFAILTGLGQRASSRLRTCHFECTSPYSHCKSLTYIETLNTSALNPTEAFSYPHLEHLASHLVAAHFLLHLSTQPNLASLEILPDPDPNEIPPSMKTLEDDAETKLLQLVHELPVLAKLKVHVPACWASDALREACEAKGVALLP
ncbi:hypothetical protein RQP46_006175 [Phenoliferia psychrophenolica]